MVEETYKKDPDAVLDFAFDWTIENWLESSETISSHTITVPAGITLDTDSESTGLVTVWPSGGTHSIDYIVACKIVTSLGRTEERSILIRCRER